jgi:hypothetical protein
MSKIKIKRSTSAAAPSGLEFGELAYSTAETAGGGTQANNGDRLFFKYQDTNVTAVIGGKYFTDMLDHAHGTLTADSAIITDSNSKVDQLKSGDLVITGSTNTIKNMASDSDIHIDTTGTGKVNINNWKLPNSKGTGTDGWVLTIDETTGQADWAAPSTTLNILLDSGDNVAIDLLSEEFTIEGDNTTGVDTVGDANANKVTIKMKTATSSQLGVAKFDTTGFVVSTTSGATLGNVTLKSDVAQSFGDATTGTATPAANKIKIVGDTTSGVLTTASSDQVKIEVGKATTSQLGVAKFNADYWNLTDNDGNIKIYPATTSDLGVAKFKDDYFTVVSGLVTPKDATLVGNVGTKGIASFKSDNFSVTGGEVTTKSFTIGSTSLNNGGTETVFEGLTDVTIGDLNFASDEITSTGDINLLPGTGKNVKINNAYSLPSASSTTGYVLTINGSTASWQAVASTLNYKVDSGTTNSFDILNGVISILGDSAINTTTSGTTNKTITIGVDLATSTSGGVGVASFGSGEFNVSVAGDVELKSGSIANSKLTNSKVTIGTTDIDLGASSTVLDGLTDVTIGDIQIKSLNTGAWTNEYVINAKTGDLNLGATGGFVNINGYYTLPNASGSATTAQTYANALTGGQALVSNGSGGSDWTDIPYILQVNDGTNDFVVELLQDVFTIEGDTAQNVSVTGTGTTFVVSVATATTTIGGVGVASFAAADFGIGVSNNGEVTLDASVVKSVAGDTGTLTPTSHSFNVNGYTGSNANTGAITTDAASNTLTITARLASDTQTGVASFDNTNFTVDANGAVTANSIYLGTTELALGDDISTNTIVEGLTSVTIGDIQIHDDHVIENVGVSKNITLMPGAGGIIEVFDSNSDEVIISGVADPVANSDAANKRYVDHVAQGLHTHYAADTATTAKFTGATYDNGVDGVGATITLASAISTIDGHPLTNGDRILVKNEGDAGGIGSYANGIYNINSAFTILTRADDFNTIPDINGGDFVFVVNGLTLGDTGWVQTEKLAAIGSGNPIIWNQFSGAGTYIDGDGILLTGNTFSVRVDTNGGIEIADDKLQLKSTLAGDGLTYSNGVLTVGGTADYITVSADTITIANTYAGQASITTLGTITAGTWQADTVMETYGGTGQDSYAKGDMLYASDTNVLSKLTTTGATSYQFMRLSSTGIPEWSDIDGGTY